MKILLLSDTHIPDRALDLPEKFKEYINTQEFDLVIHLGDFTSLKIYFYFKEKFKDKFIAVLGNMDDIELENYLKKVEIVKINNLKILCFHGDLVPRGHIPSIYRFAKQRDVNIVFTGHTHIPLAINYNDIIIVNPGSLTNGSIRGAPNTFAIIEILEGQFNVTHILSESLNIYQTNTFSLL